MMCYINQIYFLTYFTISDPRGMGMKSLSVGVRRSKFKVT